MGFISTVVGRYLFSSRGDRLFGFVTVFSVIGIAIGVAAINTVQAAQNGIIAQTLEEARRGIPDVSIRPEGGVPFAQDLAMLSGLQALEGVRLAEPFVEGQAAASLDGRTEPMALRGVPQSSAAMLGGFDTQDGMLLPPRWFLVLPQDIQRRLAVYRGSVVEVISADGQNTALGWTPRSKDFEVLGFHDLGGSTPTMYAPLGDAQLYLRLRDQWSGVALDLDDGTDVEAVLASVAGYFARVDQGVTLETWEDVNVVQADVFRVMKRVMAIVLALIMLIAGFNILASQLMLVREKRMSIAVFRTMGTGRGQMVTIFVAIGLAIGLGGVVAGLGLTALFALLAQGLNLTIPLAFAVGDLLVIGVIAVAVCFLATLYPALRAASIDPAIALRDA